ncbi:hypothetical protein Tco_0591714 [Tanacetum coccineum]
MSSPNHPTSNIEDAFSSNFPDYIPASPDYVPASPGKTYSSSSNNSFGLVLKASPTLSLFHDDPYMKNIYRRSRKWNGIHSKRFDNLELNSESLHTQIAKTSEQANAGITTKIALNASKRTSTSDCTSMTKLPDRKLVADSVTAALEAQAVTMANADNTNRNTREREAPVVRKCSYKEFIELPTIKL